MLIQALSYELFPRANKFSVVKRKLQNYICWTILRRLHQLQMAPIVPTTEWKSFITKL